MAGETTMTDKLPPLPKPFCTEYDDIDKVEIPCFSDAQMRAYAEEAVRLERERSSLDVELGKVAMRFVDRAGDVADCDPAERICAEFYAAASEVCDREFKKRNPELWELRHGRARSEVIDDSASPIN